MRQDLYALEMVGLIGEAEVVRHQERRAQGRRLVFGRIRSVFACLFVATVLVFTFCYRADLQDYTISHLYQWSQAELKTSSFRQSALNHENEVNRVIE